jgi:hypothetical protein
VIRAYRFIYPDSPHAPPHLWETEQPYIEHLPTNARTFGRQVVQRYFRDREAYTRENARIWAVTISPSRSTNTWHAGRCGLQSTASSSWTSRQSMRTHTGLRACPHNCLMIPSYGPDNCLIAKSGLLARLFPIPSLLLCNTITVCSASIDMPCRATRTRYIGTYVHIPSLFVVCSLNWRGILFSPDTKESCLRVPQWVKRMRGAVNAPKKRDLRESY